MPLIVKRRVRSAPRARLGKIGRQLERWYRYDIAQTGILGLHASHQRWVRLGMPPIDSLLARCEKRIIALQCDDDPALLE